MEGNVIHFNEDAIIVHEGDVVPYMYYVLSGSVLLYLNYLEKEETILGVCSKGTVFCELGILSNVSSLYTAVAYGENTKVLKISQDNFVAFIKKYPENAVEIMKNVARINSMLVKNLELLSGEIAETVDQDRRNRELRENIARYSVRGIDVYNRNRLEGKEPFLL